VVIWNLSLGIRAAAWSLLLVIICYCDIFFEIPQIEQCVNMFEMISGKPDVMLNSERPVPLSHAFARLLFAALRPGFRWEECPGVGGAICFMKTVCFQELLGMGGGGREGQGACAGLLGAGF
jgi:hypothetical protein